MPVEIRELVIRFKVEDKKQEVHTSKVDIVPSPKAMKNIVNECAEIVLQKIEKRFER